MSYISIKIADSLLQNSLLQTDFSLHDLDIVLKGTLKFFSGYIQLDAQYLLTFNLCFTENHGRSFNRVMKLKNIDELNRFVTSDYQGILTQINYHRDYMKSAFSDGCELKSIGVKLERYRFDEFCLPI